MEHQHGKVTRLMAARCEHCPLCRHARKNPDTMLGKAIRLHGRFCPFWHAWEKVYGDGAENGVASADSPR